MHEAAAPWPGRDIERIQHQAAASAEMLVAALAQGPGAYVCRRIR